MDIQASDTRAGGSRLERAVVLELLADEGGQRRSLAELGERLGSEPVELETAVTALVAAGVLRREDDEVCVSGAARRLDELDLIAI
jgi:DNA-binding IclR family transcriptional regulator